MSVSLSPILQETQFDNNGNLLSGGLIQWNLAGSSTPGVTYTDNTQSSQNTNPIVLNARGEPPNEIWLVNGIGYKATLKSSTGSVIRTFDNIFGVNDVTSIGFLDEWIEGPVPTLITGNSFSVAGDKTVDFAPGRRVKISLSSSDLYGTITSSSFSTSTTVNVIIDNGASIDSTINAVKYGVQYPTNTSIPQLLINQHIPGLVNGYINWTLSSNALTATLLTLTGSNPTPGNPVYVNFRNSTGGNGNIITRAVTSSLSITVPNTATLGTVSGQASRIYCTAIDTGTGVILGLYNPLGHTIGGAQYTFTLKGLDDSRVHSSSLIGLSSDSSQVIYSQSAQSSKAIAIVAWFESLQTTAGSWAQNPIAVHTIQFGSHKTGDIVSSAFFNQGDTTTITVVAVEDNTIPQSSESGDVMAVGLSLISIANFVKVDCGALFSISSDSGVVLSIFKDADVNAIASTNMVITGTQRAFMTLCAEIMTTSTSLTIKSKVGSPFGTITLNGLAGTRYFGGVANTYIRAHEIWV